MKKIIVSILAIGCLLTSSITSVNAFDVTPDQAPVNGSLPAVPLDDVYLDETHDQTLVYGPIPAIPLNGGNDGDGNDPSWEWAKRAGASGVDEARNICVDSNGNSYITGYFEGTASFGDVVLTSNGGYDIFVAKLDTNGNWQWAKKAGGGSNWEAGYGISVDSNGNCYVTGRFIGTASFGDVVLTGGIYCTDMFVAKLDTFGNWQWAKNAPGEDIYSVIGSDISVDSNGNLYVTGSFMGTIWFGGSVLTKNPYEGYDIFVAKIDTNGNWQWAKQAGGADDNYGYGISVDSNGNSYVTGTFKGTASFGDIVLQSSGYEDIFVAKIDTDGNWQWAKKAGGGLFDEGRAISVDSNGNCYVTGRFQGIASFGSIVLIGGIVWFDFFVAKLDTNDGSWQWAKQAGGNHANIGVEISVDSNGNLYVTGSFMGTIKFGSIVLECKGHMDVFVVKLDADGNWQWAKQAGGINCGTQGWGISVDSNKNVYVAGDYSGTVSFDNIVLPGYGSHDIFVAKLNQYLNAPEAPTITGPLSGNAGTEYTYTFVSTDPDGDDVYYWIEWGDGTVDDWFGPCTSGETATASHIWDEQGTYTVRAKAKDTNGLESDWSDPLAVTITSGDNQPPNKPTIDGPNSGKAGTSYMYTFTSTDPNGDDVSYYIEWGDGETTTWTAFQTSGSLGYSESHTWSTKGTYTIEAKTKDINGAESDWATLSVSMPKNKESNNKDGSTRQSLFSRLVDGFRGSTPEPGNQQPVLPSLFTRMLQSIFERSPSNTQTPAPTTTPLFPIIGKLLSRLR